MRQADSPLLGDNSQSGITELQVLTRRPGRKRWKD